MIGLLPKNTMKTYSINPQVPLGTLKYRFLPVYFCLFNLLATLYIE
jgi:hypothetical protein